MTRHRNDIYGDASRDRENESSASPAIPAATVLLLREEDGLPEVLMLHKNSKIAFGGLWVFPGGRIDPEDYETPEDHDTAARNAAVREAEEEAGIVIPHEDFVYFSHWTPPPSTPKRFSTWFFVTGTEDEHEINIDDGEIKDHKWISPGAALDQHAAGEIDLAPPTWVSLYQLARFSSVAETLDKLREQPTRDYRTRIVTGDDGARIALWAGDDGYESWSPNTVNTTHRLVMKPGGFEFLHSAVDY